MTVPPADRVTLNGSWGDGNTKRENKRGELIPEIPSPIDLRPHRYRCPAGVRIYEGDKCGRTYWTLAGYQAHYALEHVLAWEPWMPR